jgi:hypothetical protein
MKRVKTSFPVIRVAALGLTVAMEMVHADPSSPARPAGVPVTSPNRVTAEMLYRTTQKPQPRKPRAAVPAVGLIDVTGAEVGRYHFTAQAPWGGGPSATLLTTFNDEALAVGPLIGGVDGLRWGYNWSLGPYYESVDCSGPGYIADIGVGGAKYFGLAFQEDGARYIFIAQSGTQVVTLRSLYDFAGSTCELRNQPIATLASPIVSVVPASTFGVEPFVLK